MKLKFSKFRYPILLSIILIFTLFSASYQGLVPSYLDEICVLGLAAYLLLKTRKINKPAIYSLFMYLGLSILTIFLRAFYDVNAGIMFFAEIFNDLKPLIVIIIFSCMSINTEYRDWIFKVFVLLNIPSVMMSLYQYENSAIGYAIGLKMRNGVGRISGFAGHPIAYGFILASIILILIYYLQKKEIKFIHRIVAICSIVVSFALLIFTQSRLPLALLLLVMIFSWAVEKNASVRILLIILGLIITFFVCIFAFPIILSVFADESATVRMVGVQTGLKSLLHFPLFGTGLGTFGTASSFELHSYVYEMFDVSYSTSRIANLASGVYFESGFFSKIVQNGILGTAAYYYLFVLYLVKSYRKHQALDLSIMLIIVLNSILNPIYRLPGIFLVGVCMSHINYIEKNVNINRSLM